MGQEKGEYFESYEDLEIHKLMLEDVPRTEAYRKAILNNKSYINGKVVMDVGCGTGILSIFCAQAGAKKVYAVEASNVAKLAEEIVKENKFQDIVQVINSMVEDVVLPDDEKVDIIVSEWMGFYLLHEGMLDSVIFARDKFLKEGGHMFPESATIYVAPCSVPSYHDKWKTIYGVKMNEFGKRLRHTKDHKPEVMLVDTDDILGEKVAISWINMREDSVTDLDHYNIKHVLGASKSGKYEGICVWFTCLFPSLMVDNAEEEQILLCTGPSSDPTHWKQTVIVLPETVQVEKGGPIAFDLTISRSEENSRRYNLQVTLLDPETTKHPMPCSCHMTKCIVIRSFLIQNPSGEETNGIEDNSEESSDDAEET